jgi:hypothetical protein
LSPLLAAPLLLLPGAAAENEADLRGTWMLSHAGFG